jgi:hypothetical protein
MPCGAIAEPDDEGEQRHTHEAADDEFLRDAVHGRLLSGLEVLPLGVYSCHDHDTPFSHKYCINSINRHI